MYTTPFLIDPLKTPHFSPKITTFWCIISYGTPNGTVTDDYQIGKNLT